MNQPIAEIWPSYYWPSWANVLILSCKHRHVRPSSQAFVIGEAFDCCFCDDVTPSAGNLLSRPSGRVNPPSEWE